MKNKKAYIELMFIVFLVAIVLIGYFVYKSQQTKALICNQSTGVGCFTKTSPIKSETKKVESCQEGYARDNAGVCVQLQGSSAVNQPCPTGQVRTNDGVCVSLECAQGQIRNANGDCIISTFTPDPKLISCTPSGYIKSAYVFTKGRVGLLSATDNSIKAPVLSYTFVVTSDCEANYYFEGGIANPNSLTILVTQPSACDGNVHYAGQWIKGSKNTKFNSNNPNGVIDLAFFPQDYAVEGNFQVVGGVYTGCFKDGGKSIQSITPQTISISNSYSDNDVYTTVLKTI